MISTNSIIHYTNSIQTLKLILKEGFRLKYCDEMLQLNNNSPSAAHPMVCFCDIPLSESSTHFESYGYFGIGLTKSWAVENKINPVLYLDKSSLIANIFFDLFKSRKEKNTNLNEEQKDLILRIKTFAKNYSGDLDRNGKIIPDYRYYDEREWRFIPDKELLGACPFTVDSKSYQESKETYNTSLDHIRVKFKPSNISYIIVKETNQIPEIIKSIKEYFSDSCTANELDILLSKVCSAEQIKSDY
jgi:hypothetical protein